MLPRRKGNGILPGHCKETLAGTIAAVIACVTFIPKPGGRVNPLDMRRKSPRETSPGIYNMIEDTCTTTTITTLEQKGTSLIIQNSNKRWPVDALASHESAKQCHWSGPWLVCRSPSTPTLQPPLAAPRQHTSRTTRLPITASHSIHHLLKAVAIPFHISLQPIKQCRGTKSLPSIRGKHTHTPSTHISCISQHQG